MKMKNFISLLEDLNKDLQDDNIDNNILIKYINNIKEMSETIKVDVTCKLLKVLVSFIDNIINGDDEYRTLSLEIIGELLVKWEQESKFNSTTDKELDILWQKIKLFSETDSQSEDRTIKDYNYDDLSPDIIQDFIEEAEDLIGILEKDLLYFSKHGKKNINRIFRGIHTIKGMSGMMNISHMTQLAHIMETKLDAIRNGKLSPNEEIEELFLAGIDYFRDIVVLIKKRENPIKPVEHLINRIKQLENNQTEKKSKITKDRKSQSDINLEQKKNDIIRSTKNTVIRVDVKKMDMVMNQIGELLIEKSRLDQDYENFELFYNTTKEIMEEMTHNTSKNFNKEFINCCNDIESFYEKFSYTVEKISKSISELQENAIKMRLVPLDQIFSRFPRLVRDTSKKLNKKIDFFIEGEDTEIDKSVCELLAEPLIHLIRNSIDHGIEDESIREKTGKPVTGKIILKAYYIGDKVGIDIVDDGKGLDSSVIGNKALANNLITESDLDLLEEREILNMIFKPGFSTADEVSDLSGRGVGMDVVKKTIERLKGTIDIKTEIGAGTTVSIKLPLTLAILKILLFNVHDHLLAIPLYDIRETLKIDMNDIYISNDRLVTNLREKVVPLIDLSEVLDIKDNGKEPVNEKISLIILDMYDKTIGLIVNKFLGKKDIIIKNFGIFLNKFPFVLGGAILGEGEVVAILDPIEIMNNANDYLTKSSQSFKLETDESVSDDDGQKQKILVVEDSKSIASFLCKFLQNAGYNVDVAYNGMEALEMVKNQKYDAISTDIVMPGLDGYELTKKLRKISEYKNVPIIALTTKGSKFDRVKGFQSGIDEYLKKPIDENLYLSTLHHHLSTVPG